MSLRVCITNKKGLRMADLYMDWTSFGVGFTFGIICVWFVCDLVFPLKK